MEKMSKLITTTRTTEANTVASGIIHEYQTQDWSTDVYLTGIFTELIPENDKMTSAVNRIKAESDLEEKDEQRDNKVRSLYYLIMGFIHHPDATISSAAKTIDAVFEHYGVEIVSESYATESSLIESLLLELAKPELQTSIALLPGLEQLIGELQTTQTAFEEAQLAYQNEKASEGNLQSATEIKKTILSIINEKLIVYLRAMVMVDETRYGSFAETIEQIIDDMNVIVKKRKKITT